MGPILFILLIVGFITLAIFGAKKRAAAEQMRLQALAQWAQTSGFSFSQMDPQGLSGRYQGLGAIGQGHDQYAFEVLSRPDPVLVNLFRYHYKTWETRTVRRGNQTYTERVEVDHWNHYLVVELSAAFPNFDIRREGFFDKIKSLMGFDDINFESEEFSRKFHVRCADRQFAYSLVHPTMIEFLMDKDFQASLGKSVLMMEISKFRNDFVGCGKAYALAVGFINRIPDFVWQDYGKRGAIKLPEVSLSPAGAGSPSTPTSPPTAPPPGTPGLRS